LSAQVLSERSEAFEKQRDSILCSRWEDVVLYGQIDHWFEEDGELIVVGEHAFEVRHLCARPGKVFGQASGPRDAPAASRQLRFALL